jgi:hypothetical protein
MVLSKRVLIAAGFGPSFLLCSHCWPRPSGPQARSSIGGCGARRSSLSLQLTRPFVFEQ